MPKLRPRGKVPRKVGSRSRWQQWLWGSVGPRSKPENPVVENHPDGRGGLATYPSLLVSWIGMFYQVLQKSNIQLGMSFKFFLIFSHDFVKISNFDEFKNEIASFCEENTCFPLSYLVFTCKSLSYCGVCQIEANLHLTTRTKGNSLFYDYGRQELVWVFGATSMEESSQSVYVGFQNWKQKHFYLWSFLLLVTRPPQDNWRSPILWLKILDQDPTINLA